MEKLQISRIKLHITDLLENNLLHLVTILLVDVSAGLNRLVRADQPLLGVTQRLDAFLLALVTDLSGLLLAILGVAVLLCLLRASLHLEFADLLRLEMAVLFLHWEGEDVGKLLAVPVYISLANLDLDFSRDVVAILGWLPVAHNTFWPVSVVLGALVPLAVEFDRIGAGNIVNNLFLHVAVRSLHVGALVVVLGGHIDLVGGVAHPVLSSEASLHLVGLFERLVVDGLNQVTHKLAHVKTNTFNICFDYSRTIVERFGHTRLLVLCVTSGLRVGLALVLEHHLLDHVAVGILVDTVASDVSLPNIRMVPLYRSRCWILLRMG